MTFTSKEKKTTTTTTMMTMTAEVATTITAAATTTTDDHDNIMTANPLRQNVEPASCPYFTASLLSVFSIQINWSFKVCAKKPLGRVVPWVSRQ